MRGRWHTAVVLGGLLVAFQTAPASASHNGPTRAEVLGFDSATQRVYFAQFDESEVGYAPVLYFFDLRAPHPERRVRVPGPLYEGDDGVDQFEQRIDALRIHLTHPERLDSTAVRLEVHAMAMPDTVAPDAPEERMERFALHCIAHCQGRKGAVDGVAFGDSTARVVRAGLFSRSGIIVATIGWTGVWIGSTDDYETCVLLAAPEPRKGVVR